VKRTRKIADGVRRVGRAVRRVLKASHTKKEMLDLRREKLKKLYAPKKDE